VTRGFNGTKVQLLTNARSEKVNRLVSGNSCGTNHDAGQQPLLSSTAEGCGTFWFE
jgi:hypothetical protein